jgi:hypothetical protein
VLEETGVAIDPGALWIVMVENAPDRQQTLLFCLSPTVEHEGIFVHDTGV